MRSTAVLQPLPICPMVITAIQSFKIWTPLISTCTRSRWTRTETTGWPWKSSRRAARPTLGSCRPCPWSRIRTRDLRPDRKREAATPPTTKMETKKLSEKKTWNAKIYSFCYSMKEKWHSSFLHNFLHHRIFLSLPLSKLKKAFQSENEKIIYFRWNLRRAFFSFHSEKKLTSNFFSI